MTKMNNLPTSIVLLLAFCIHSIRSDDVDQRPVVETIFGPVRGRARLAENGAVVNEFLGIPYAAPPVGDLRFKKTAPAYRFEGTFDADMMPPACPQYSDQPLPWYDNKTGQSEDCLYLNIWVPGNITDDLKRPVKFYVHGGGWFEGGSIRMGYYDGFGEAIDTKDEDGNFRQDGIVVVTANYRLGALGFLASGLPDEAPGNMGLFDISQAIRWTLYLINKFGGDTGTWKQGYHRNFTLVGQGSGAIAVSLLKTTPSRVYGDIAKVVLNGGSLLTLKALEGVDEEGDSYLNNLRLTDMLAEELGCPTPLESNRTATIECLKGIDVSRLVKAAALLSQGRGPPNIFLPQIRGPDQFFGGSDPYYMIHEYYFSNNSLVATFTSEEGSSLLTTSFPKAFGALGDKDIPLSAACSKAIARKSLKKFPQSVVDDLLGDLDTKPSIANRDKVIQAFGDAYINCPVVYVAEEVKGPKILPTNSKAYMLEKQVYPPNNPWASWMGSVGFNNVQIDFLHPNGTITVNNKRCTYTTEQREQAQINKELLTSFMATKDLPIPEFTLEDPFYSVLGSDGKISDGKKSNFHGRNCDILRPYFTSPEIISYEDQ